MIGESNTKRYTGPWTEKQLMHLLRRTLCGVSVADYHFFKGKTMDECLDILLITETITEPFRNYFLDPIVPKGELFDNPPEPPPTLLILDVRIANLKGWWAGQLLNQKRSVTEKMILFWHNHFAVEFNNVKDSRYAYQYINLLYRYPLGNFKKLVNEITVNPCMLVYLNGSSNKKGAPNENYGRELQELFTIGKGPDSHYTEDDVKAASKVLSGWKDDKTNISSYFDPDIHDTDTKQFSMFYNNYKIKGRIGKDGAGETEELIEMICANKEVSKFLCRKLYRFFVDSTIDEKVENEIISPLAELLLVSNYEVKPVIKALLSADFFYNDYLIGGMIKSPVDYFIGLFREFDVKFAQDGWLHYKQWAGIAVWLGYMGQDLGDPPGVAGWPAYYEVPFFYRDWTNSETLSFRAKVARLLSYPSESDRMLMFDFIHFISKLSNPVNVETVINETITLCCGLRPGPNQMSYLKDMLDTELNTAEKWNVLWSSYEKDHSKEDVKEKLTARLAKTFSIIFTIPEFHLM